MRGDRVKQERKAFHAHLMTLKVEKYLNSMVIVNRFVFVRFASIWLQSAVQWKEEAAAKKGNKVKSVDVRNYFFFTYQLGLAEIESFVMWRVIFSVCVCVWVCNVLLLLFVFLFHKIINEKFFKFYIFSTPAMASDTLFFWSFYSKERKINQ